MPKRGKIKAWQIIPALILLAVILVEVFRERPVDWSSGFGNEQEKPYGGLVAFELLSDLFPQSKREVTAIPVYNTPEADQTSSLYVFITSHFNPGPTDAEALLAFADRGNEIFVSATSFSGPFADSLRLKTGYESLESFTVNPFRSYRDTHQLSFADPSLPLTVVNTGYAFTTLTSTDTSSSTLLCSSEKGEPVMMRIRRGKGNIYVHTVPELFSNFHLLRKTAPHFAAAFSFPARPGTIIWDEYYKPFKSPDRGIFGYLKSQPGLYHAFLLILFSGLLVLLLSFKRKYPLIPVWKKPENHTADFVRTIGALYYQSGAHGNLVQKMRSYFYESLRERFGTRIFKDGRPDAELLSSLSGVSVEETGVLSRYIEWLAAQPVTYEKDLLKLNKLITSFNAKSKR